MAKTKSQVELTRVNLNLPAHIVEDVKDYAMQIGLPTTSAYIILICKGLGINFGDNIADYKILENDLIDLVCGKILTNPKVVDRLMELLKED